MKVPQIVTDGLLEPDAIPDTLPMRSKIRRWRRAFFVRSAIEKGRSLQNREGGSQTDTNCPFACPRRGGSSCGIPVFDALQRR